MKFPAAVLLLLLFARALAAGAATYHLDPVAGRLDHDGSAERPWPRLERVIAAGFIQARDQHGTAFNTNGPVRGGDCLLLHSGPHGEAILNGYFLDQTLEVAAAPGAAPQLARIVLRGGSRWRFHGLAVSPVPGPGFTRAPLIAAYSHNQHGPVSWVSVEDCEVASAPDSSGWTTTNQWLELACDGITFEGAHCRAVSNRVRNVAWGIQLGGVSNYAGYNLVENFRGDGVRALNHHVVVEHNVIRNAFLVDENHMDGIQGFFLRKPGREVRGVVVRGNVITRHERLETPLVSPYLQGIGFFDGPFVDCVFEDNVVVADSYHGISVYNATRCRITGNVVQEDAGSNLVQEARIVLGCKAAYGREVRDNVISSNRCDRLIIAPEAVNTVLEGNVVARPGR